MSNCTQNNFEDCLLKHATKAIAYMQTSLIVTEKNNNKKKHIIYYAGIWKRS